MAKTMLKTLAFLQSDVSRFDTRTLRFFRWSFKSYSLEFCFDTPVFHCTLSIVACVADETKPRYNPIPGFSFVCNAGYFNSRPFVLLEMSIRGSWSREVVELLRINILNLVFKVSFRVVKVLILTVLISFLWRSFLQIHEPGPLSLKSSVQGVWAHQQREVGVLVPKGNISFCTFVDNNALRPQPH